MVTKDTLRFGCFFGLSTAAYQATLALLQRKAPHLVRGMSKTSVFPLSPSPSLLLSPLSSQLFSFLIFLSALHSQKKYHSLIAGAVAGLVSAIDSPGRRQTLTLFMLARALGMLVIILNRRGLLPTIPRFVTILYGICQGLILVAVTRFPSMLPPNYYRALLRWSQYYTEEKLQVGMKETVHKLCVPFLPLFFPLSLPPSFLLPSIPPLASSPS